MSDTQRPEDPEDSEEPAAPGSRGGSSGGTGGTGGALLGDDDRPLPQPIRFYGTTWLDHTGGYGLRRAGLGLGALVLAALGAFALRLAYGGFAVAEVGQWVRVLLVLMFAICSSIGFSRTLARFGRRPQTEEDEARERSMRSFMFVGFVGVLLAYAVRTLIEAPGEKLHRTEYREALERYERRRRSRTRNPAKRKRRKKP